MTGGMPSGLFPRDARRSAMWTAGPGLPSRPVAVPTPGVKVRRAIERRIIVANTAGGLLVGSYFILLRDVDPGDTLLQWWIAVMVTSLSFNIIGAGLTLLLSRRFLGPRLRFL